MEAVFLSRQRRRADEVLPQFVHHKAKSVVYSGDASASPWRVVTGAVALERIRDGQPVLAGLALSDDIIGLEGMLRDRHQPDESVRARTIVPTEVVRWSAGSGLAWTGEELMRNLLRQQQRTVDLLSLRSGSAQERIIKLVRLLGADGAGEAGIALPTLRDMSFITCIAGESICRELKRLHDEGQVVYEGKRLSMRPLVH